MELIHRDELEAGRLGDGLLFADILDSLVGVSICGIQRILLHTLRLRIEFFLGHPPAIPEFVSH